MPNSSFAAISYVGEQFKSSSSCLELGFKRPHPGMTAWGLPLLQKLAGRIYIPWPGMALVSLIAGPYFLSLSANSSTPFP